MSKTKKLKVPKKEYLKPTEGTAGFEHTLGYGGPKALREHVCLRCGGNEFRIIHIDANRDELIWTVACRGCEKESRLLVAEREKDGS